MEENMKLEANKTIDEVRENFNDVFIENNLVRWNVAKEDGLTHYPFEDMLNDFYNCGFISKKLISLNGINDFFSLSLSLFTDVCEYLIVSSLADPVVLFLVLIPPPPLCILKVIASPLTPLLCITFVPDFKLLNCSLAALYIL